MRLLSVLVCLCFCVVCPSAEQTPSGFKGNKDKLHIYLLIGQSNMAGRAKLDKTTEAPFKNTLLLNDKDNWEVATHPLNKHSTIRKDLKMQRLNLGYSFSLAMATKDKKVTLGLVVNAKGGSSIKSWKKGTKFYTEALRRANLAQKTGVLKGILWHQGESDSKDTEYLDKLKTLVTDLRSDLKQPQLPFIAGQVNNLPLINDQIAKLPASVAFTGFVKSEGLKAYDRWHFDTPSMLELGKRYAVEMHKVQTAKSKKKK